ncbi:hypothetical protein AL486_22955 [Pandoraea apista]|nr:hypothetical protein SG18_04170 [Pandoraea apista]AKH71535.1 hypothetical protein XM39_04170 [Pandoraea apista]AKI63808.1 hypothetical protein AA956_21490 [Pandoraea apista]AVF42213.1 hypothetical protein AL486_22955 [Pandoraea apista]OXS92277.1 hypothetical protein B7H01_17640 [Pandoraea apista]
MRRGYRKVGAIGFGSAAAFERIGKHDILAESAPIPSGIARITALDRKWREGSEVVRGMGLA